MASAPQSPDIGTSTPVSIKPEATGPPPDARCLPVASDDDARGTGVSSLHDLDQREATREQTHSLASPAELTADLTHVRETLARRDATIEQLRQAVASRDIIGQAKGILMERLNLTAADAFTMLISESNQNNQKLVEVASKLVHSGGDITPPVLPAPASPIDGSAPRH